MTDDDLILIGQLAELSPYNDFLVDVMDMLPPIMESNDQLAPVWQKCQQLSARGGRFSEALDKQELNALRAFFEFVAFSTNRFSATIRRRQQ